MIILSIPIPPQNVVFSGGLKRFRLGGRRGRLGDAHSEGRRHLFIDAP